MKRTILLAPLAAVILLLVNCPTPVQPGTTQSDTLPSGARGGSLVINLPLTEIQPAKGADPGIVSSYDVLGSGPGNASFQKLGITAETVTVDSLAPGDWGVTVNGNNFMNVPIESTSVPVTIVAGETRSAKVAKSQLVSKGTLDLSMEGPAGFAVSVWLTPQGGSPAAITMAAETTTNGLSSVVHATNTVPSGYYTLALVLTDESGISWGGAEAVLVSPGITTFAKLVSTPGNKYVRINPDISNAIPIAFYIIQQYGSGSGSMTVTATPTASQKHISYQWYLNGSLLEGETTPEITLVEKTPGFYRLDVVVSVEGVLCSSYVLF